MYDFFSINLFQAIRRLSEDDHEVIKESCVILNRVFTTVEFKDTMETFEKEPEKLGQHILIKEEEEMKSFEKNPEKLGQHIRIKREEEMKSFEKKPEKLGQLILNKEKDEMKSFEKEPENLGQPLLSEDVMYFTKFMLVIICSLIFPVALMYAFNLNN